MMLLPTVSCLALLGQMSTGICISATLVHSPPSNQKCFQQQVKRLERQYPLAKEEDQKMSTKTGWEQKVN